MGLDKEEEEEEEEKIAPIMENDQKLFPENLPEVIPTQPVDPELTPTDLENMRRANLPRVDESMPVFPQTEFQREREIAWCMLNNKLTREQAIVILDLKFM